MTRRIILAAVGLVALTGAATAGEGKPRRLHCTYGPIVIDVDENDNITSNLPAERRIELRRANGATSEISVRPGGYYDLMSHDTVSCVEEYPNVQNAPFVRCYAVHYSKDDIGFVSDSIYTINNTFETDANRPGRDGYSYSFPDSRLSAVLMADDGVTLIRDGERAMLITSRGRATCFTKGPVAGDRGTLDRSDADLVAEAWQNARANQDAVKLFATATCKFDNGFAIDHGILYAEGHDLVPAAVSKTAAGYAVSALHGGLYVNVSPSGAAAFGTYTASARKDGKPLDQHAWVATDELVYRNVPLRGTCTGL